MKVLAILFRVVFSIIVLLLVACYLQSSPTVTFGDFFNSLGKTDFVEMLSGVNGVTISIAVILLLTILTFTRLLEAAWNVLFCSSIIILLAGGLYALGGPQIALPNALYNNEAVQQFCQLASGYQVPGAITLLIFIVGWLCTSSCVSVAITAVISYGLWYAVTEFFTYIVHLWASGSSPAMPEALQMIQNSPWILAAVPAAFFLIYAILMAFFETYIFEENHKKAKESPKQPEAKPATEAELPKTPAVEDKPTKPITKTRPVLLKTTPIPEVPQKKLATKPAEPKKDKPELKMEEAPAKVEAPAKEEAPAKVEESPAKEETPATKEEAPAKEEAPVTEAEKKD